MGGEVACASGDASVSTLILSARAIRAMLRLGGGSCVTYRSVIRHIHRSMSTEHSDLEDERLLRLATEGDKQAFGALYERYLDDIYRYVYFRVGDEREAEDITANAFLRTWEHLPRLSRRNASIGSFRNWIYRVAKNLVIDHYRAKKTVPLPEDCYDGEDLVKNIAEQNRQTRQVASALAALKPDYQQILILRFINQLSHKACAEIMGRNTGQTRVLQHRALKKLREIIKKNE